MAPIAAHDLNYLGLSGCLAAMGVQGPPTPPLNLVYADASGDRNPIHLDEEAAHRVGLDSIIAHGMLSMAFLGQFVTQQIAGNPEAYVALLKVRFMSMVRLGDTLTCHGLLKARTMDNNGDVSMVIECWAQNQKGEKVTTGEAVVSVPLWDK